MAVRMRLQRRGSKKKPFYSVVAADSRKPRDGRFLEKLGTYDPRNEAKPIHLDLERVNHWIGVGALPSDRVAVLIKKVRDAAPAEPAAAES